MSVTSPLFINYAASRTRDSSLNVAVARFLIGSFSIWKLLSYDILRLPEWPEVVFLAHQHRLFHLGAAQSILTPIELALAVVSLVLFTVGYRIGLTAFVSALLCGHLSALHYVPSNSATTFLPLIYAMIFLAIYRSVDVLSIDGMRSGTTSFGRPARREPRNLDALRWILIALGLSYFFTGFAKLQTSGLGWATADNIGLYLHHEAILNLGELSWAAQFALAHEWLRWLMAVGTLVLELGFLVAILARLPITPFILGLAGMHTGIYATMDILFFDLYFLYLVFVPWDRLHRRLSSSENTEIEFNPNGPRRLRWFLRAVEELDLRDCIRLTPVPSLPGGLRVRCGADERSGGAAAAEICRRLGFLRPLAPAARLLKLSV